MKKLILSSLLSLAIFTNIWAQTTISSAIPLSTPYSGNCIPLGSTDYGPYQGFAYKNIPAFIANVGDTISFDIVNVNDISIQRNIFLAHATNATSPLNIPAGYTQVVSTTQTPQNSFGNTIVGDYELKFIFESSYSFPGGTLVIAFSGGNNDSNCDGSLSLTSETDASNNFLCRFFYESNLSSSLSYGDNSSIGGYKIISQGCSLSSINPDIINLPNITDECFISTITAPTATDNCGNIVNGVSNVSFPITTQGTTVITWTYTSGSITSTQSQNVVINDITPPIIVCPGDITVNVDPGTCGAVVNYTISATDNCSTFSEPLADVLTNLNNDFMDVLSVIPNSYVFNMDGSGGVNSNNINDGGNDMYDGGNFLNTNFAGNIQYSDNLILNSSAFGTTGKYFTRYYANGPIYSNNPSLFVMAADLDNVSNFTIQGNNGADGGGSTDGTTFNTTVNGINYNVFVKRTNDGFGSDPSINQVMIVPENVAVSHTFSTNTNDGNHSINNLNASTRIYYLLYAGNAASYINNAQTQTIVDAFLNTIQPGTNTGTISQTLGTLDAGDNFPVGTTTLEYTATDESGNTDICTFNVTVIDNVLPNAICQNQTLYLSASGNASMVAADIDGGSTDNCGIATLSASQISFDCSNLGVNTITLTVTDINGNTNSCNASINVIDTVKPVVVCQNATLYLNASGNGSITTLDIDNGSTDVCGIASYSLNQSLFDCSNTGIINVTLTVTDNSGNTNFCTATVTVFDTINPVLVCNDTTLYLNASGNAGIVVADITSSVNDNCSVVSISASQTSFDCSNLGANSVVLTATDASGNTSTCTAIVTILDTISPIIPNLSNLNGSCDLVVAAPTTSDNCAGTVTGTTTDATAFNNPGTYTINWTFTDLVGNSTSAQQQVTITDFDSPTPNVSNLADVVTQCEVLVAPAAPMANDNCAGAITGTTNATFPISTQGTTIITWSYDDGNGNIITQMQNIIITDDTAPLADVTNLADINSACQVDAMTAPTATDNCSGTITATTSTVFPITTVGTTVVTWDYSDANGNVSSQTQNVVVYGVNVQTTINGSTITASSASGTFQWINCSDNSEISGATSQSFTPTNGGSYAVIVDNGNCLDTSECVKMEFVGLEENTNEEIVLYPNPSNTGRFTIKYTGVINNVYALDMTGRQINLAFENSSNEVDGSLLAPAKYMIVIETQNGKFLKEMVIFK